MNYDSIQLSEEELKAAILEGKKKKYFKEKNRTYWESQERGKTNVPKPESQQPPPPRK